MSQYCPQQFVDKKTRTKFTTESNIQKYTTEKQGKQYKGGEKIIHKNETSNEETHLKA